MQSNFLATHLNILLVLENTNEIVVLLICGISLCDYAREFKVSTPFSLKAVAMINSLFVALVDF
jgi:hypothetical protein